MRQYHSELRDILPRFAAAVKRQLRFRERPPWSAFGHGMVVDGRWWFHFLSGVVDLQRVHHQRLCHMERLSTKPQTNYTFSPMTRLLPCASSQAWRLQREDPQAVTLVNVARTAHCQWLNYCTAYGPSCWWVVSLVVESGVVGALCPVIVWRVRTCALLRL